VIIRYVSAKVATAKPNPQAQQRDIDCARGALRPRRRRGVPALFAPPEPAHAGAVIKRKREVASGRNRLRRALQCFVHRSSMVQHAPGIDHVEST
jgi:hypothetical protein